jgi:hypothetical protein
MDELDQLTAHWTTAARSRLYALVDAHVAAGLPLPAAIMLALAELIGDD